MRTPFFSIVVPTRNRAELLPRLLESVLGQTFPDFELVISDNDAPGGTGTAEMVRQKQDSRISYHRTSGTLSMADNWECARRKITGEYMLVLEDKQRLLPGTLEALHHVLTQTRADALTYPNVTRRATEPDAPHDMPPPAPRKVATSDVIKMVRRFDPEFMQLTPRGLDSCVSRRVIQQCEERDPAHRVFSPMCPDFAFGFRVLACVSEVWRIDAPLAYTYLPAYEAAKYSNFQSQLAMGAEARNWLDETCVSIDELTAGLPVRSPWLLPNYLLYDYRTKYLASDSFSAGMFDVCRYYVACFESARSMQRKGAEVGAEYRLIWKALARESPRLILSVLAQTFWVMCRRLALRLTQD